MNVRHILAGKGDFVVAIPPDRSLEEAARLLSEKRIGALLVLGKSGEILGILSERDIVRAVARGADRLTAAVSEHMTPKVITCSLDTPVTDLMEEMTSGRFRHIPVMANGRLVGMVSIGDVVKHRLAEIEAETNAMRDYIATA